MFLIVYLSVFLGIHTAFFFRIRVLLPDKALAQWITILFLTLMILAPMSSYFLERNGHDLSARFVAHIGFYWMGFIFYAFFASFFMWAFDLFSWCLNTLTCLNLPLLNGKIPVLVMIGLVTALCFYGSLEARNIRIERLQIETGKLPEGINSLKIVQISDLHLGLIARGKYLKNVTDKIESESPDILVCTGDLADSSMRNLTELTEHFRQLRPGYGKYAVLGNHENYVGNSPSIDFLEKSGFVVLRGETKTIKGVINIAGVDDSRSGKSSQDLRSLSSAQNGLFTIFLKHRPEFAEESLGRFDLQLSGHTHGGQIFPFNYLVRHEYPLMKGYHKLGKSSAIYINRGTGTWGPPMRILSPPEITVIELVRKGPKQN